MRILQCEGWFCMELFIDTPQRIMEREKRRRIQTNRREIARQSDLPSGSAVLDLDEPDGHACQGRGTAARDVPAAESYRLERAYDRRRGRKRKLLGVLRMTIIVLCAPFAVGMVFIASYAITYVLQGADPQEVGAALSDLLDRVLPLAHELFTGI